MFIVYTVITVVHNMIHYTMLKDDSVQMLVAINTIRVHTYINTENEYTVGYSSPRKSLGIVPVMRST